MWWLPILRSCSVLGSVTDAFGAGSGRALARLHALKLSLVVHGVVEVVLVVALAAVWPDFLGAGLSLVAIAFVPVAPGLGFCRVIM